MSRSTRALLIGIAYSGFVALGIPGALLGVAWPSMRASFDLSLDAVGSLLVATSAGYLVSSFNSGPLVSRIGVGNLLMISSLIRGVGLLGYSLSPAWWMVVVLGFCDGMGGGAIDAGLNTYFATNHSPSLMNWLHASYGLGAALGPILMTALLNLGQSWRWGYVVVGGLEGLLALCFGLTRDRWQLAGPESPHANPGSPARGASSRITLTLPIVWLGIALFVVFTGAEGAVGQWSYTLFTEARSVAPSVAGVWTSVYWGSLTVGRIFFGIVADRWRNVSVLRVCMLGIILGCAAIWWHVADMVSFLGLALAGFAVAPLYPLLTSDTPARVGADHAANAIGFQVAATSLGAGLLSGLAGVLAEALGLEVIGPFLFVASIAIFALHEMIVASDS